MSNEKTQLYAGNSDESGATRKSENASGADNQQGRIKYRAFQLCYFYPKGDETIPVDFEANSDDEAREIYRKMNDRLMSGERHRLSSVFVYGLIRINQEEKTTKII